MLAALYLGCASVAGICSMSLRQQVTPDHLLGRVTAAFWTIHFSLGPLGAALLTWTAGHYGVMPACRGQRRHVLFYRHDRPGHSDPAPGIAARCRRSRDLMAAKGSQV